MLEDFGDYKTIHCDKCGAQATAHKDSYNEAFYEAGWSLSPRAKKYVHRCYDCLTTKEKAAFDFVKSKFKLN